MRRRILKIRYEIGSKLNVGRTVLDLAQGYMPSAHLIRSGRKSKQTPSFLGGPCAVACGSHDPPPYWEDVMTQKVATSAVKCRVAPMNRRINAL